MKKVWIAVLVLFFSISSGVTTAEAREPCRHHRECTHLATFQKASGLPPRVIAKIQRKFQGRIVGVRPSGGDCKDIEKEVMIRGKKQIVRDFACRNPDGTWGAPHYQVQVLTRGGKVLIVTVSPSGRIVSVQE